MVFREDEVSQFHQVFEERKDLIRSQPGCHGVQLLQDHHDPRIHFTFSLWESEDDLNKYRNSDLFGETWKLTKSLFAEKAQAWSLLLKSEPGNSK